MLSAMDTNELQRSLGAIVLEAAYMERMLRAAFSALVGSKYAAVVDGRLMAFALIEDCRHIAKAHTDLDDQARHRLVAALDACEEANRKRNRVIHDAWATRPGDVMVTLQSTRSSHDVTVKARTIGELHQLADEISGAADHLTAAISAAFGSAALRIEDQLRLELGHDISTEFGT